MKRLIKNLVLTVILIILLIGLGIAGYLAYLDTHSTNAKNYLESKYGISNKEYIVYKYVNYVYEDLADCSSLWFKECSSDETLVAKYVFINKDKKTITVTEYKDDVFIDDYDGDVLDSYLEENEQEEDIKN